MRRGERGFAVQSRTKPASRSCGKVCLRESDWSTSPLALQTAGAGQAAALMAERGQHDKPAAKAASQMCSSAGTLNGAFAIGKQQGYIEDVWRGAHDFKVVVPGGKAKHDHHGMRV